MVSVTLEESFSREGDVYYCLFYDGPKECPQSIILSKVVKDHTFSHLLRFIEATLNEFTQNASNLICQKINIHSETSPRASNFDIYR